jgi:hypothetical protein
MLIDPPFPQFDQSEGRTGKKGKKATAERGDGTGLSVGLSLRHLWEYTCIYILYIQCIINNQKQIIRKIKV